jgi:hypothetical protein
MDADLLRRLAVISHNYRQKKSKCEDNGLINTLVGKLLLMVTPCVLEVPKFSKSTLITKI